MMHIDSSLFLPYSIKVLEIDITDKCNLSCIYCYHKNNAHIDMGMDVLEKVAKIVNYNKIKKMIVLGGEPFLALENMIWLKNKTMNCKIITTTNMTLLCNKTVNYMRENGIVVHFSFDGPEEIQNLQRPKIDGSGSFHMIDFNLATQLSPNDCIRATVTPFSESCFYESARFILSMFKMVFFDTWGNVDRGRLIKSIENFKGKVSIRGTTSISCKPGIDKIAIATDGDVYPCHRFVGDKSFRLGNIMEPKWLDEYQAKCLSIKYLKCEEHAY